MFSSKKNGNAQKTLFSVLIHRFYICRQYRSILVFGERCTLRNLKSKICHRCWTDFRVHKNSQRLKPVNLTVRSLKKWLKFLIWIIKLAWILVQYRCNAGPYNTWYYNCMDNIFNVKFSCIVTAESIICKGNRHLVVTLPYLCHGLLILLIHMVNYHIIRLMVKTDEGSKPNSANSEPLFQYNLDKVGRTWCYNGNSGFITHNIWILTEYAALFPLTLFCKI